MFWNRKPLKYLEYNKALDVFRIVDKPTEELNYMVILRRKNRAKLEEFIREIEYIAPHIHPKKKFELILKRSLLKENK